MDPASRPAKTQPTHSLVPPTHLNAPFDSVSQRLFFFHTNLN